MKRKQNWFVSCVLVLTFSGLLSACTDKTTAERQEPSRSATIQTIQTQQASPTAKATPIESVQHQLQWVYTTQEQRSPAKSDIQWAVTWGNDGVVLAKAPDTAYPWYNFVFLTAQGQEWDITAIADSPCAPELATTDRAGLALPMNEFWVTKMAIGAEGKQVWTFASSDQTLAIGRYPREPFAPSADAKTTQVKGIDAWLITSGQNQSVLYYYDQDRLVWLAGGMSEAGLLQVAASLPSVADPAFPSHS